MRTRQLVVVLLCLVGCAVAPAPASAKLTAEVAIQPDGAAQRILATLRSDRPLSARKRPTSLQLKLKGKLVVLARQKGTPPAGTVGTYRSGKLTGARASAAQALIGTTVTLTSVAPAGRSTVRSTARAADAGGGSGGGGGTTAPTPTPSAPTTPGPVATPAPTPAPLFARPASPLVGDPAYQAVKGYFADATLTTCVAGWPNCSVEERYSIAADGTFRYCRLTPNAGSDINNVGTFIGAVGAEQAADGSWAVSFQENSYGNVHQYTFRVAADGSASVLYWDGTTSFSGPQTSSYTGFTWVRGAKTCAY